MVKRAPTPPPRDDDPQVVVVTHPYPGPNVERRDDLRRFVFWIACCMGPDHYKDLYSVWHKPTAADMILIEVCHGFGGYRGLFGEHKWSEFLRKPPPFESSVSRIYPSTFVNGRAVEKAGWKRVFVENKLFEDFSVETWNSIVYPYPVSSYCLAPKEDQTVVNVCLPIPLHVFGLRAPTPPSAPVGSSQWIVQKEAMTRVRATPPKFSFSAVSRALGSAARPPLVSPARASSSKSSQPSRYPQALPPPRYSSDVGPLFSLDNTGLPDWPETEVMTMVDGTPFLGSEDGDTEGDYVGNFDAASPFEDFGSLTIAAPSPKEPEKPPCITHGTVCKKGICRDYRNQLKRIEREKNGEGRGGHNGSKRGASSRGRGFRGRGGW